MAIPELGINIVHPTVDWEISAQFTSKELRYAETLTSKIQDGTLTWKKTSSGSIETPSNYDSEWLELEEENVGTGEKDDRGVNFKDLLRGITLEPTGFVNRVDSVISWNDSTRQISVTPVGASFDYYIKGERYHKTTTQTATITDTDGSWFIYFNGDTLVASQTPWSFDTTWLAFAIWDATNNKFIFVADERHGLVMDHATHSRLHRVNHTQIENGGFQLGNYVLNGDGSSDDHARISITNGYVHDEDIRIQVVNTATPSNPFEQKLNPIAWAPIYYKSGTAWRRHDATQFPVIYDGVDTIQYNLDTAGSWSLANVTNGHYVEMWAFMTTNIDEPFIFILGQRDMATVLNVSDPDLLEITEGLPFSEFKFLYKLIFRSSTSYTNTPKALLAHKSNQVINAVSRGVYQLISNGVVSNNEWVTFSELTPAVWIPFPYDASIAEIAWDNKNNNRSFDLEFYKNDDVSGLIYTYEVRNKRYGHTTGLDLEFTAGDRLRIKYVDQGSNASDLVVLLHYKKLGS